MAVSHVEFSHVVSEIGNILAVLAKNTTLITASLRSAVINVYFASLYHTLYGAGADRRQLSSEEL